MSKKKTLIVYYSMTGNCQRIAAKLADMMDADIEEVVDKINYKGVWGMIKCSYKALFCQTTEIQPLHYEPSDYEKIVLITPIWAGKITPAIRTYLTSNMDRLNYIGLVTCSGTSTAKGSMQEIYRHYHISIERKVGITDAEVDKSTFTKKLAAFAEGILGDKVKEKKEKPMAIEQKNEPADIKKSGSKDGAKKSARKISGAESTKAKKEAKESASAYLSAQTDTSGKTAAFAQNGTAQSQLQMTGKEKQQGIAHANQLTSLKEDGAQKTGYQKSAGAIYGVAISKDSAVLPLTAIDTQVAAHEDKIQKKSEKILKKESAEMEKSAFDTAGAATDGRRRANAVKNYAAYRNAALSPTPHNNRAKQVAIDTPVLEDVNPVEPNAYHADIQ